MENGKLLVASADLLGEFEERPAAHALRNAILEYAASEAFEPPCRVEPEAIESYLFPMNRMEELTEAIYYDELAVIRDEWAIVTANPGQSVCVEKKEFPITITMKLRNPVLVEGMLYVPEQRERYRNSYPKDFELLLWNMDEKCWKMAETESSMQFQNSSLSQKVMLKQKQLTDGIRMVIKSCYGSQERDEWEERPDGYYGVHRRHKAMVKVAGLHVLCDEEAVSSDIRFLGKQQKSTTKEIDD